MKRRQLLLGLPTSLAATRPAWAAAEDKLWASRFARPAGGELVLQELKGRWLFVNFWATWCAPCIRELPDLDAFARAQTQWTVLGLAVDGPTPVREFLAKRPVSFAIGLAGLSGSELARQLGNKTGALPFSVALNPQGRIVWRRLGVTHPADLEKLAELPQSKG